MKKLLRARTGFFFVLAFLCVAMMQQSASAQDKAPALVRSAVIKIDNPPLIPISRLDTPIGDEGFQGARLAVYDNQTTGRFLGQEFVTDEITVAFEDAPAEIDRLIDDGAHLFIIIAEADQLLALADHAKGRDALFLNASAPDDRLRGADCRANIMHIGPSRAMLADGLAQYLVWKKWREWLLIHGSHPGDIAMAEAYRRAAKRFGAKIVEERIYEDTGGSRRTDTGHVLVQKQMPIFTQRAKDHDVVIAADENEVFGWYLPYRTWDPRPVAGGAGLRPVSWHPGSEAWGATQFQRRFERQAGRTMKQIDYQVWAAVRIIGEAASRAGGTDFATLRDYILSDKFELAAFKGQKLTFRPWNHQLRQPIMLVDEKLMVSASPQDEFLHRVSRLDTLGYDEPESDCSFE